LYFVTKKVVGDNFVRFRAPLRQMIYEWVDVSSHLNAGVRALTLERLIVGGVESSPPMRGPAPLTLWQLIYEVG
jgi:hypothetical protein